MSNSEPASGDRYAKGIEQLRSAAKWLLTALAAVGAVLISGVQITGLGGLSGHRLAMAVVGVALGLLGVTCAILATGRVLVTIVSVPEQLTTAKRYDPLRKLVARHPVPLLRNKAPTLEALIDANNAAQLAKREAYDERLATAAGTPQRAVADREFAEAEEKHEDLEETVSRVQSLGLLLVIRRRFSDAVFITLLGGVIAAVGAVIFAYWANPPKSFAPTTVVKAHTKVHLILTPTGEVAVRHRIGQHCDLTTLKAIVLGGTEAAPDVVVIPARHCAALRLTVPASIGETAN